MKWISCKIVVKIFGWKKEGILKQHILSYYLEKLSYTRKRHVFVIDPFKDQFGEYDTEQTRNLLYLRRTQQTVINTQYAVKFFKQTLQFTDFSHSDQIALIKVRFCHHNFVFIYLWFFIISLYLLFIHDF